MSDLEFDVLDELYFPQSFEELSGTIQIKEGKLKEVLEKLVNKKWVKCFKSISEALPLEELDFENDYRGYHYLATKEGLLAHNSR